MKPATRPFSATLPPRPLYLAADRPTSVSLDGPALCIRLEARAEQFIPLRRVSRIMANAMTGFSTEALLACADRGIAVVFLDSGGAAAARLLGRPGERQEMRQRLIDRLDDADWPRDYGNWVTAMERKACLALARAFPGAPDNGDTRQLTAWLRQTTIRCSDKTCADRTRDWMWGLTDAWLTQHLSGLGLGGQSELLLDGSPDLFGDLGRILHWYVEPVRLGWLLRRYHWSMTRQTAPTEVRHADIVRLFERNNRRIGARATELVNHLHRWLVEVA